MCGLEDPRSLLIYERELSRKGNQKLSGESIFKKQFIRSRYDDARPFHKRIAEDTFNTVCGLEIKSSRSIIFRTKIRDDDLCYYCKNNRKLPGIVDK